MADPRKFRGVRLSPQGDAYVKLVAARDRTDFSKALRYLLALGARADMEAQDGIGRPDSRAGTSGNPGHVGEAGGSGGSGDRDGGAGSGAVPLVPDPGGSVGDAIGALIHAGFRPEAVDTDSPGAA